jgi:C_GCAxxG_C_C family probable redox protein
LIFRLTNMDEESAILEIAGASKKSFPREAQDLEIMLRRCRMENIVKAAVDRCEAYRLMRYHCSESSIRACSEVLNIPLPDEILRISSGFRGGGGAYGDRCGVTEAGIMLISLLYGRTDPKVDCSEYSYLIRLLHERFNKELGSYYCRILRPFAYYLSGPDENCAHVYRKGTEIVTRLLLEADQLIKDMPESERYGKNPQRPYEKIRTDAPVV